MDLHLVKNFTVDSAGIVWVLNDRSLWRIDLEGSITAFLRLPNHIYGIQAGSNGLVYVTTTIPDRYGAGREAIYRLNSDGSLKLVMEGNAYALFAIEADESIVYLDGLKNQLVFL